MYLIILTAIIEMFKALIPVILRQSNEPTTAADSPAVPKHIRNAWRMRRRWNAWGVRRR